MKRVSKHRSKVCCSEEAKKAIHAQSKVRSKSKHYRERLSDGNHATDDDTPHETKFDDRIAEYGVAVKPAKVGRSLCLDNVPVWIVVFGSVRCGTQVQRSRQVIVQRLPRARHFRRWSRAVSKMVPERGLIGDHSDPAPRSSSWAAGLLAQGLKKLVSTPRHSMAVVS